MKKGASEIVVVLDRSGSMVTTRTDAEGGLLEFIRKQRELPGECNLTFYRFDNEIERVFEDRPLSRVSDSELRLDPRGSTALLDAMGQAIDEVGARLARRLDYDRPEFVYFVVITDGQENASWKHTVQSVFSKITHQRDIYKWQFIFIGANQDAIATAAKLGIGANSTLSYNASRIGTQNTYKGLSDAVYTARATGQSLCFTAQHREESMKSDDISGSLISTTGGSTTGK